MAFRHGLRAAEVCDLRRDQVDFNGAVLHVRRVKNGIPSTHPFHGDELRALRWLHSDGYNQFRNLSDRYGAQTGRLKVRQDRRRLAGFPEAALDDRNIAAVRLGELQVGLIKIVVHDA